MALIIRGDSSAGSGGGPAAADALASPRAPGGDPPGGRAGPGRQARRPNTGSRPATGGSPRARPRRSCGRATTRPSWGWCACCRTARWPSAGWTAWPTAAAAGAAAAQEGGGGGERQGGQGREEEEDAAQTSEAADQGLVRKAGRHRRQAAATQEEDEEKHQETQGQRHDRQEDPQEADEGVDCVLRQKESQDLQEVQEKFETGKIKF